MGGVRFTVTDREVFRSTLLGLSLMETLQRLYPKELNLDLNRKLIGSRDVIRRVLQGQSALEIERSMGLALTRFGEKRQQYLIYP